MSNNLVKISCPTFPYKFSRRDGERYDKLFANTKLALLFEFGFPTDGDDGDDNILPSRDRISHSGGWGSDGLVDGLIGQDGPPGTHEDGSLIYLLNCPYGALPMDNAKVERLWPVKYIAVQKTGTLTSFRPAPLCPSGLVLVLAGYLAVFLLNEPVPRDKEKEFDLIFQCSSTQGSGLGWCTGEQRKKLEALGLSVSLFLAGPGSAFVTRAGCPCAIRMMNGSDLNEDDCFYPEGQGRMKTLGAEERTRLHRQKCVCAVWQQEGAPLVPKAEDGQGNI